MRACVRVWGWGWGVGGMRRDHEIEVETEIISRIHKCSMTDLFYFFLLFVCLLFFFSSSVFQPICQRKKQTLLSIYTCTCEQ